MCKPNTEGMNMEAVSFGTIDVSAEGDRSLFKRVLAPSGGDTCNVVISETHGARKPKLGDSVTCHYRGRVVHGPPATIATKAAADAAAVEAESQHDYFDDSFARKQPLTFILGVDPVIKGWTEVLLTMATGERSEVFIAPHKAYGSRGRSPRIPPNAWLCFELLLLAGKTSDPTSQPSSSSKPSQDQPSPHPVLPSADEPPSHAFAPTPVLNSTSDLPPTVEGAAKDVSGGLGCVWKLALPKGAPPLNSRKKFSLAGDGHNATPEDLSKVALEVLLVAPKIVSFVNANDNDSNTTGGCLALECLRGVAEFTVDSGCPNQWDMLDWCAKALTRGETGDFLVKCFSDSAQGSAIGRSGGVRQASTTGTTAGPANDGGTSVPLVATATVPAAVEDNSTRGSSESVRGVLPTLEALFHNGVFTNAERFDPSSSDHDLPQDEMSAVQAAKAALSNPPFSGAILSTATLESTPEPQPLLFVRATLVALHCGRKPVQDMTTLEKITCAGELHNEGNDWFSKGAYARASRRYSSALNLISVDQGYSVTERRAVRSEGLLCFLNRALCSLKTQKPTYAKRDADFALGIEPGNVKGLFRRGAALLDLEKWAEARDDLRTVVESEPTNKAAARMLRQARAKAHADDAKARQLFQGAFSNSQEQTDEEMAFSSAPPKKAEFGKETSKKKKGVLLYEDKDNISPAQKAKKDEQQRFKGIREIKGKVAVVEAIVPDGASAGDKFDWLLPGSNGAVASVTVPSGAKGGDKIDLEVCLDNLGDLRPVQRNTSDGNNDDDDDEDEKPLGGPLQGIGKGIRRPPLGVWLMVACMGFGLLGLAVWPFLMHSSDKDAQYTSNDGGAHKARAESEVLLRFLGLAFLATGAGAMADSHWNQSDFGEVYTATTFALAFPTALMSVARVIAFGVSSGVSSVFAPPAAAAAALPDPAAATSNSIAAASSNFLPRAELLRMALGFATMSVALLLAPFLGGWKVLAARAAKHARGLASIGRPSKSQPNLRDGVKKNN